MTNALETSATYALSLYDLGEEQLALDALSALESGEWTVELEQLAAELVEKLVVKADSFGGYIKELESREDAIAAEISRLTHRKKATANRIAWMKTYGCTVLQRIGRPRIEGSIFTLALQNNPASVHIAVMPDKLDAIYQRVVPAIVEPNKIAIGAALKAGVEIEGCSLVTTQSLRIK